MQAVQEHQQYSSNDLNELLRQRQELAAAYGRQAAELAAMHDQLSRAGSQLTLVESHASQEVQRIG